MKAAIMQPYFFPYIGYFQLINAVDVFILYDDVTYIKGGWIARNRIYERGSFNYWGVSLEHASSNRLIKDIKIDKQNTSWQKLLKTIQQNYGRTPYSSSVWNSVLLEVAGNQNINTISELNEYALYKVCKYIGIETPIIRSSELPNLKEGRIERLVSICNEVGADVYINAIGGKELYTKEMFKTHGIDLYFLKTNEVKYKQASDFFVANLSILDVLMYNSKEQVKEHLQNFELE
ncbi:MAG: WbqC family protein [Novosphingobium sp.]|nr:WbqC family protein [Novosphingobium sp.]